MALLTRRALPALGASVVAAALLRKPARGEEASELAAPADLKPLSPAAAAPAVQFQSLNGTQRALAAFRGHPVVLNFWATWCSPCIAELPGLDRLAADAPDLKVLVVSVDHGGAAAVSRFLLSHPVSYASVLIDPHSDAVQQFGVFGYPTTLLIDARGQLRSRLDGPAAWAGAAAQIRGLVA